MDRVELELCGIAGLTGDAAKKTSGRSNGPTFATKPALGPPGSAEVKCSRVTAAWRQIQQWLRTCLV
eukprot:2551356-Karenia_brevis.AAC.1